MHMDACTYVCVHVRRCTRMCMNVLVVCIGEYLVVRQYH